MFDWLFDVLFQSLPKPVQIGCTTVMVVGLAAILIWTYLE